MVEKVPKDSPRKRAAPFRSRQMTEADVDRIVLLVRHWPKAPLTWEDIRAALASEAGRPVRSRGKAPETWTRQTLAANQRIKSAYEGRRKELAAKGTRKRRTSDPEATVLRQQVEHLKIELKTARAEAEDLRERYRALLWNRAMGLKETEVETPLPTKIDRTPRKE